MFFRYLKIRVLLANKPLSLAWSFAELEPPVVNVSVAAYVNCDRYPGNSKLRRVYDIILHTVRQPRIFTDNELHLLESFHHQLTTVGLICMKGGLEIKCYFLKLISSSYDIPVASYT